MSLVFFILVSTIGSSPFGSVKSLHGYEDSLLSFWMTNIRHWAPVSANTMSSADCWRGPGLTWVAFVFIAASPFLSLFSRRAFSFSSVRNDRHS